MGEQGNGGRKGREIGEGERESEMEDEGEGGGGEERRGRGKTNSPFSSSLLPSLSMTSSISSLVKIWKICHRLFSSKTLATSI